VVYYSKHYGYNIKTIWMMHMDVCNQHIESQLSWSLTDYHLKTLAFCIQYAKLLYDNIMCISKLK